MKHKTKDIWRDIDEEVLTKTTKKLANWKAPGPDRVQNFWIKHLYALHPSLTQMINDIILHPHKAPK
jgi:hypothetical protein